MNITWATLIIEELTRWGITHFCISPGSRSEPLVIAVAQNRLATHTIHYDERSAAYFALGYGKSHLKPAALICTSGTAVANYYPAVIEAYQDSVPMIVISADRPDELKNIGENQTIDQIDIYGKYICDKAYLDSPTIDISAPSLLAEIDRVAASALKYHAPVHINCPFPKPFSDYDENEYLAYTNTVPSWSKSSQLLKSEPQSESVSDLDIDRIIEILNEVDSGLIVIGKLATNIDKAPILKLFDKLNWPVFPDIQSQFRFGRLHRCIISKHELMFQKKELPNFPIDTILHIGGTLVSVGLINFLEETAATNYIAIDPSKHIHDPKKLSTIRAQIEPVEFCNLINDKLIQKESNTISSILLSSERISGITTHPSSNLNTPCTEQGAIQLVLQYTQDSRGLFLGNSLTVREAGISGENLEHNLKVIANRGVSGIDGNLSTAFGFSFGLQSPVTAIVGDLTCLHDINSLSLVSQLPFPIVIVCINNYGGGIFKQLPIASNNAVFEKFFKTPHELSFSSIANCFGLKATTLSNYSELSNAYEAACKTSKHSFLEVIIL